jgi:hypothetical protein
VHPRSRVYASGGTLEQRARWVVGHVDGADVLEAVA